jgi:hypothetical protein
MPAILDVLIQKNNQERRETIQKEFKNTGADSNKKPKSPFRDLGFFQCRN